MVLKAATNFNIAIGPASRYVECVPAPGALPTAGRNPAPHLVRFLTVAAVDLLSTILLLVGFRKPATQTGKLRVAGFDRRGPGQATGTLGRYAPSACLINSTIARRSPPTCGHRSWRDVRRTWGDVPPRARAHRP
jgi:hypothetical protein